MLRSSFLKGPYKLKIILEGYGGDLFMRQGRQTSSNLASHTRHFFKKAKIRILQKDEYTHHADMYTHLNSIFDFLLISQMQDAQRKILLAIAAIHPFQTMVLANHYFS